MSQFDSKDIEKKETVVRNKKIFNYLILDLK